MNTTDPRAAVIAACTRMAWLADQRDWAALEAVFTETVLVDYTSLEGGEAQQMPAAQLVENWRGTFDGLTATHHMLSNFLIEIGGERATCTADFQATHLGDDPYGDRLWTLGGTYRFELSGSAADWRIAKLTMNAIWGRGNRHIMTLAQAGQTQAPEGNRA